MRAWSELRERLRTLLLRSRTEREMDEELQFHLEMERERLIAEGLSPEEARRRAVIDFGGVERVKEEVREARGIRPLEHLAMDARYALRHFRRTPVATATMVLVLVLGIGANTALFTAVESMLTQPPPGIRRDEALVRIRGLEASESAVGQRMRLLSYPEVLEYARHRELFTSVAAWSLSTVRLEFGGPNPIALPGGATYVTSNYFAILGVKLVLGAGLPRAADRVGGTATPVGVISHTLWMRHYGGTPDVLGKTVTVEGVPITIVGVAPPRFAGVEGGREVWLPLAARTLMEWTSTQPLGSFDAAYLSAVARLRPGVTASDAAPTVRAIAARAAAETRRYREDPRAGVTTDIVPLLSQNSDPRGGFNVEGVAATGLISLLILLVTCTNVAGLLVGMADARRREIAVRLSLGATRARIVRQLLTESVLVSMVAGGLGLVLLWVLIATLGSRVPDIQFVIDGRVAVFSFGFAVATGILFGVSPALHATRLSLAEVLKSSAASVSGSRSWLHRALVVTQIALTQPLLVALAALLLVVGGQALARESTGPSDHLISLEFDPHTGGALSSEELRAEFDRLVERLSSLRGVAGVVPQDQGMSGGDWTVHPADRLPGRAYPATFPLLHQLAPPGYLRMVEIPVVQGREFTAGEDHEGFTSVILGQEFARQLWGTTDPIGRRLVNAEDSREVVVVGLVEDDRLGAGMVDATTRPVMLVPYTHPDHWRYLVRTRGVAEPLLPAVRSLVTTQVPALTISRATTLAAEEAEERKLLAQIGAAGGAGGLLALLLSAIGLYAVISFAVGQRQREIGIRTALGAPARRVVRMFFATGLRLSLLGLVIGLPFGLLALRVLAQQGNDVPEASMPLLASLVALFVLGVASIATWIPARRAAAVDPMAVLRSD